MLVGFRWTNHTREFKSLDGFLQVKIHDLNVFSPFLFSLHLGGKLSRAFLLYSYNIWGLLTSLSFVRVCNGVRLLGKKTRITLKIRKWDWRKGWAWRLGTFLSFKNLYDESLKSTRLENLTQWAQINAVFIKCFMYKYRLHTKHALNILNVSVFKPKKICTITISHFKFTIWLFLLTVGSTQQMLIWTLGLISMLEHYRGSAEPSHWALNWNHRGGW